MISLLINLPSWAVIVPFVLLLFAALATLYAVPPRLCRPVFTGLAVLLACWLAMIVGRDFYQRGKADERATWQKIADDYVKLKREAADKALAAREIEYGRIEQTARPYDQQRRKYYAARPADRDTVVFDADRVRQIRAARAAVAAVRIDPPDSPADRGS